MKDTLYLTLTIWSLAGFWCAWQFGFRRLLLDNFRDSLFVTRERLYRLAQEGSVSCDAQAYRAVETLINNSIRYAHRLTFAGLLLMQYRTSTATSMAMPFTEELRWKIRAVDNPVAREELDKIFGLIGQLIFRFAAKSSPALILFSLCYLIVRRISPALASKKKTQAVVAFEREVYYAPDLDGLASV